MPIEGTISLRRELSVCEETITHIKHECLKYMHSKLRESGHGDVFIVHAICKLYYTTMRCAASIPLTPHSSRSAIRNCTELFHQFFYPPLEDDSA